jgi:hypothetical protein
MRITNHAELHPWRSTGPGPVPATPAAGVPAAARAGTRRDAPLDATTPVGGFPHGICNAATAYTSSAGTDIAAYDDLPGYHLLAAINLIAIDDESYHGSDSEPPPATSHGYAEWDFSGVPDLVMFQRFLDAADYWFSYSNTSTTEGYDPSCERFTVGIGDVVGRASAMGAGDGEYPRTRG